MKNLVEGLLLQHKLISDQVSKIEVKTVLSLIERVVSSDVPGDICEFGCYSGTTSLFIVRLLRLMKSSKKLYVYDSFAGLPEKRQQDASPAGIEFKPGELSFSKKQFINNFRHAKLKPPFIKKGWFEHLSSDDLPNKIALAFLDGDYYESVLTPLNLIKDALSPGSIIIVDDYSNPKLPGPSAALCQWLSENTGIEFKFSVIADMAVVEIEQA